MKIAVSIPDELFAEAEREARRRGVSRSRLYAQALEAMLARDSAGESALTRELNEIYADIDSRMDPVLDEMQRRTIAKHSEW